MLYPKIYNGYKFIIYVFYRINFVLVNMTTPYENKFQTYS